MPNRESGCLQMVALRSTVCECQHIIRLANPSGEKQQILKRKTQSQMNKYCQCSSCPVSHVLSTLAIERGVCHLFEAWF